MSQNNNLEQFISQLQNEIILAHNKSQDISLAAFNKMFQQLQQAMIAIQKSEQEVKRLKELCEKNKIEHTSKKEDASKKTDTPKTEPAKP